MVRHLYFNLSLLSSTLYKIVFIISCCSYDLLLHFGFKWGFSMRKKYIVALWISHQTLIWYFVGLRVCVCVCVCLDVPITPITITHTHHLYSFFIWFWFHHLSSLALSFFSQPFISSSVFYLPLFLFSPPRGRRASGPSGCFDLFKSLLPLL